MWYVVRGIRGIIVSSFTDLSTVSFIIITFVIGLETLEIRFYNHFMQNLGY